MKVTPLAITTASFIFLLLIVLLQNRIMPPPPPPLEATLQAVSIEATRVAQQATQTTAERQIVATTDAVQSETSHVQTQTAREISSPMASPVP